MWRAGAIFVVCVLCGMIVSCGKGKSDDLQLIKQEVEVMKKEIADLKGQLIQYKNQNAEVMKQTANVVNELKSALVKIAGAKLQSATPQPNEQKSRTDILQEERIREEARRAERDRDDCTKKCGKHFYYDPNTGKNFYESIQKKCMEDCYRMYDISKPK
jgi:uncharacterized membrane-anchored protein YhcB (DUF1043 family)